MNIEKEFLAYECGYKNGLDDVANQAPDVEEILTIVGIFKSLDDWRQERGLQHTVGNIAANIGEEIVEYLRAENDEHHVDALCDIFVFSVNAISAMGEREYASLAMNLSMSTYEINERSYFAEIINRFCLIAKFGYTLNIDALITIAICAKAQLCNAGYDFLIAMDETLKEIHSRTGAWNDTTQKWEKFRTPEAMDLWYEADYSKAKL